MISLSSEIKFFERFTISNTARTCRKTLIIISDSDIIRIISIKTLVNFTKDTKETSFISFIETDTSIHEVVITDTGQSSGLSYRTRHHAYIAKPPVSLSTCWLPKDRNGRERGKERERQREER